MPSKLNFLAIIPARGGSKGIPKKNIKKLGGKPLIEYTLDAAKKSILLDEIIVSSDSKEILDIAKKQQINVPFIRPASLARDTTGSLEVVRHAVDFFENKGSFFNAVVLLQPTSPFRYDNIIDKALTQFLKTQPDSLFSAIDVPHNFNPHWVFKENRNSFLSLATGDNQIIKRRQDLPNCYIRDGSIYITKTDIIKKGSLYGKKIDYILSNPKLSVNIDTIEDWHKAERILKNKSIDYA